MCTVDTDLPVVLTSKTIPQSSDGMYSYDQQSFLFPHEPIRREIERAKRALDAMDVVQHPWKARYLSLWMKNFLIPLIQGHHDSEEAIIQPFYKERGVVVSAETGGDKLVGAHQLLMKNLEDLQASSVNLIELVDAGNYTEVVEQLKAFRALFQTMYDLMAEHLAAEEAFWPEAIRSHGGQEVWEECNKQLHVYTKQMPGGKMFLMSMFDAMGVVFPGHKHRAGESRWCGEQLVQDTLLSKIPWFVQSWIFPGINNKYQHWKSVIIAVAEADTDSIDLEAEGEGGLLSWCTIS